MNRILSILIRSEWKRLRKDMNGNLNKWTEDEICEKTKANQLSSTDYR